MLQAKSHEDSFKDWRPSAGNNAIEGGVDFIISVFHLSAK